MSDLSMEITGFVAGDTLEVNRTILELPSAVGTAWLTVKRHVRQSDADALLQKVITTDNVPGTGQIETAGGPGVAGQLRFDLTAADTEKLGEQEWVYDIQIKLADGTLYTTDKGTIGLTAGVTKAT